MLSCSGKFRGLTSLWAHSHRLGSMHNLLHWDDKLNWMPIVCLGAAAALFSVGRILTILFYIRRLREIVGDNFNENDDETLRRAKELFSSQKPVVPLAVSNLYFLSGVAFIGVAIWGLVSTAWWMALLGVLIWFIIHWPFREVMLSWSRFQNTWMIKQDADALLKGGLTPQQEKAIKKRLERDLRVITRAPSREFCLENPNFWTDIEHVENGGAIQLMRMEDGQFILLSIGTATAKVFVRSKLDPAVSPIELASLPIPEFLNRMEIPREKRRGEDDLILNQLRKVIGWPKSIDELKHNLEMLDANPFDPQSQ
jgi:hypothetical protein